MVPGLLSETPYDVMFDSPDDQSMMSFGQVRIDLKEIILKGLRSRVAMELVRINSEQLEKFHWQQYEHDPKRADVQVH